MSGVCFSGSIGPLSCEKWRAIPGFEGRYEVSCQGRVRSLDSTYLYRRIDHYSGRELTVERRKTGKLLRPGKKSTGHLSVMLGRSDNRQVHELVLLAFVGAPLGGQECRHLNDDPSDNRLANLAWGTRSQNLRDAVANGKRPIGEGVWNAKLSSAQAVEIRKRSVREGATALGREFRVSESVIRSIRDRKTWVHVDEGKAR